MRVIAIGTIRDYWTEHPESEKSLRSWYVEICSAEWNTPHELKEQYRTASVLSDKRIVFNIAGNKHRLIVDIEFQLQIAFIVWIGTHEDYNHIDARTINYVKTNKK
jgi:mRNA interferase HigB